METFKIHSYYIGGILVAIIVGLLTIQWGSIPDLSDRISFALTLASLLLAILAIVYSIMSSSSWAQTIGTLRGISDDVTVTTAELGEATANLREEIKSIPERLGGLEGKVTETHSFVTDFIQLMEQSEGDTQSKHDPQMDRDQELKMLVDHTPLWLIKFLLEVGNKNLGRNLQEVQKPLVKAYNLARDNSMKSDAYFTDTLFLLGVLMGCFTIFSAFTEPKLKLVRNEEVIKVKMPPEFVRHLEERMERESHSS